MFMKKTVIRKALFTDLAQVYAIENDSIKSWTLNHFTEELNRNFSFFIVAETEGVIAGYAVAWLVADELQLISIAVNKTMRRTGIGKLLLNELIKFSISNSLTSILVEVRSKNSGAVSFYSGNGFMITGNRKNYYGNDDALLMEKKI